MILMRFLATVYFYSLVKTAILALNWICSGISSKIPTFSWGVMVFVFERQNWIGRYRNLKKLEIITSPLDNNFCVLAFFESQEKTFFDIFCLSIGCSLVFKLIRRFFMVVLSAVEVIYSLPVNQVFRQFFFQRNDARSCERPHWDAQCKQGQLCQTVKNSSIE